MTGIVDRNLLIGFAVAIPLAGLVSLGVGNLPLPVLRSRLDTPAEPRARAAWAEPRDIDWRPKAAVKASQTVPAAAPAASPQPRAALAGKPHAHLAEAESGASPSLSAAPGGAVAVAAEGPGNTVAGEAGGADAHGPSAGSGDAVYGPGDVDVPPQPLVMPQAPFPPAAEKLGLSAEVMLVLIVEADGHVTHIDAHCGGCDPSFLRSARETARSWRFAPARLHGQPVRVRVEQPIHFDLDE